MGEPTGCVASLMGEPIASLMGEPTAVYTLQESVKESVTGERPAAGNLSLPVSCADTGAHARDSDAASGFVETLKAEALAAGIIPEWTTQHVRDARDLECEFPGVDADAAKAIIERTKDSGGESWPYAVKVAQTVLARIQRTRRGAAECPRR